MFVKYIPKTVAFPIVVHLLVFCKSEDRIQNAYLSNFNLTWEESKTRCTLIGSKGRYDVENYNTEKGWINETASYSPWYDYLGCFKVKPELLKISTKKVQSGFQFSKCSNICKDYLFMGLQVSHCACFLEEIEINQGYVSEYCEQKKSECTEDRDLFSCAADNEDLFFSLFRKVTIMVDFGEGNCLSVKESDDRKHLYTALNCTQSLPQICSDEPSHKTLDIGNNLKTWTGACSQNNRYRYHTPYTYFEKKRLKLSTKKNYWLANIRRPIFDLYNPSDSEQKYCVAAKVDSVGRVQRTIEDCKKHFPAICLENPLTENRDIDTDTGRKGMKTNEILVIAVLVTAVLTVIVFILVAVLIVRLRRNRTRHEHKPVPTTTTTTKEIVYAQVNKTKKSSKPTGSGNESAVPLTSNDVYDLMDHRRRSISDRQQPENDYDTMKSIAVEEDDYNFANVTNNDKKFVVNEDSEYSHVQTEYHEIGKVQP